MKTMGKIWKWMPRLSGPALTALLSAATLSLTGCVKDKYERGDVVQVGDSLPAFSVVMDDGSTVTTADLVGTVSLIMFFDTTCPDCKQTLPIVNRLYLELGVGPDSPSGVDYSSNSDGNKVIDSRAGSGIGRADSGSAGESAGQVCFVLIGREQDAETVAQYWAENGYSLPYSPQPNRAVYNLFATNIIPRIYISDPALTVRAVFDDDPLPTYSDLYNAFQTLLGD